MSKHKPLTESEQADLVAFLDGELKGEAARAVEAKVALDPRWRAEAASHKQAWELLDFLPKPEPTPSFTEKTLSKLAPIRKDDPGTMEPDGREPVPWGWRLVWASGLVAAVLGGYFGCRAAMPAYPGERELLRDLRLIENKHLYDRVDDFDFLEKLAHPDLFGE